MGIYVKWNIGKVHSMANFQRHLRTAFRLNNVALGRKNHNNNINNNKQVQSSLHFRQYSEPSFLQKLFDINYVVTNPDTHAHKFSVDNTVYEFQFDHVKP